MGGGSYSLQVCMFTGRDVRTRNVRKEKQRDERNTETQDSNRRTTQRILKAEFF